MAQDSGAAYFSPKMLELRLAVKWDLLKRVRRAGDSRGKQEALPNLQCIYPMNRSC